MDNKCLICNHKSFNDVLHVEKFPLFFGAIPKDEREIVTQYPLSIGICKNCKHTQQINLLDEDILNAVYTAEYYNCPSPHTSGMGRREIEKFHAFFQECELELGKILEIACFDGYLLKKLNNVGWEVYGCDPSTMTRHAQEILGTEHIVNDYFDADKYPNESFDVIIFRNLLEHLYSPHSFLDDVSKCLKPGGRIFIDVPNINVNLQLGGFGIFFHQHISYFSLYSLNNLLSNHTFKIEKFHEGNPNLFVSAVKGEVSSSSAAHTLIAQPSFDSELFVNKGVKLRRNIIDLFDNVSYQSIALFGASALATALVSILDTEYNAKISLIIDNDIQKRGKYLYGCDTAISHPDYINLNDIDILLVTTYFFDEEIKEQLVNIGFPKEKVITINEFVN